MLHKCQICKKDPQSYKSRVQFKGYNITCWVVECDAEEEEIFPFIEHRLTVYGSNQEEAEERWNNIHQTD